MAGKQRSGKDTTIDLIKEIVAYASVPVIKIGFADPLKEEVAEYLSTHTGTEVFDWLTRTISNTVKDIKLVAEILVSVFPKLTESLKVLSIEETEVWYQDQLLTRDQYLEAFNSDTDKHRFRKLLQWYGTDYRRAEEELYWLNKMRAKIDLINSQNQGQVIIGIKDVRFKNELDLINDYKGLSGWIERPNTDPSIVVGAAHSSENDLLDCEFDFTLMNDETIQDLKLQIAAVLWPDLSKFFNSF